MEQFKNPDVTVKFLDQFEDLKIKASLMETSLKVNASKMNVIDTLFGTKNCYDLGLVHEMLKFKGLRNTQLLKILRSYNVLDMDNMPRQEFIDKRFFRVVESKVNQASHTVMIKRVYVYQSGLTFIEKIVKKFEGDKHAKTK